MRNDEQDVMEHIEIAQAKASQEGNRVGVFTNVGIAVALALLEIARAIRAK